MKPLSDGFIALMESPDPARIWTRPPACAAWATDRSSPRRAGAAPAHPIRSDWFGKAAAAGACGD